MRNPTSNWNARKKLLPISTTSPPTLPLNPSSRPPFKVLHTSSRRHWPPPRMQRRRLLSTTPFLIQKRTRDPDRPLCSKNRRWTTKIAQSLPHRPSILKRSLQICHPHPHLKHSTPYRNYWRRMKRSPQCSPLPPDNHSTTLKLATSH